MKLTVPKPVKAEHDELHEILHRAADEPGQLGEAARSVARLMHPHFVKEEEFALPPLALLPALQRGEPVADPARALAMTHRLKMELSGMLDEHQKIVAALRTLSQVAVQSKKPEYAEFAQKLIVHAQMEEDVLYPAALLVGEYLKLKT
jgi:iron-sulfur cluster repair protein YtfE (RIC family)